MITALLSFSEGTVKRQFVKIAHLLQVLAKLNKIYTVLTMF
jgi:hypothetical protein